MEHVSAVNSEHVSDINSEHVSYVNSEHVSCGHSEHVSDVNSEHVPDLNSPDVPEVPKIIVLGINRVLMGRFGPIFRQIRSHGFQEAFANPPAPPAAHI